MPVTAPLLARVIRGGFSGTWVEGMVGKGCVMKPVKVKSQNTLLQE